MGGHVLPEGRSPGICGTKNMDWLRFHCLLLNKRTCIVKISKMLFLVVVVINSLIFLKKFSFQYDFQFMKDIVLHEGMYVCMYV